MRVVVSDSASDLIEQSGGRVYVWPKTSRCCRAVTTLATSNEPPRSREFVQFETGEHFELYLDAIPPAKRKGAGKLALDASDLQPVRRDFAFLLDRDVAAGDVVRAALGADRALIDDVGVFDVFTGPGVPEGKKSLAIEVTLQPREKTLTDAEIEAVAAKIVAAVTKATGGELRG